MTSFFSRFILFISLSFAFLGYTQADSLPLLSPKEMQAIIGDTKPVRKSLSASTSPTAEEGKSWKIKEDQQRRCNTVQIGAVLEKRLGIRFRKRANDGDVIDLVCAVHPLHPEQTIVALFYDLKKTEQGDKPFGFVFAVLDLKRHRLLSLYRDTIEEDASIRIGESSLQIDTGRYNLAPGIRALGVRMRIGHSPPCADGGDNNYLSLFVEEGKQLKPVLKDLPMSFWSKIEGYGCGANSTVDNVELTLSIAPSLTDGWHDLEVVAHHQIETWNDATETSVKQPLTTQVVGVLRASRKSYSTEPARIWAMIWPGR